MPLRLSVVIEYEGWPAKSPRGLASKTMQKALLTEAQHWHKEILPRHFTVNAQRKYGYHPRDKKYTNAKRKKMGHSRPLEWSGGLRMAAQRNRDIRANSKQATVKMSKLPAVNLSGKTRSYGKRGRKFRRIYPDLRYELTVMTQKEMEMAATRVCKTMAERISLVKARRQKTIR